MVSATKNYRSKSRKQWLFGNSLYDMSDLVIVSNRGPFSFSEDFLIEAEECLKKGTRPKAPDFGEGGLIKAMAGLLKADKWNLTWIGASMSDRDMDVTRGHYTQLFKRMSEKKHAPDHFPHIEIDTQKRRVNHLSAL